MRRDVSGRSCRIFACGRGCGILFGLLFGGLALAAPGDLEWEFQTAGAIFASPAMDSLGTSYWGSRDSYLYAIDRDGTLKWSYEAGDWIDSSPTLSADESTLYFGCWDNFLYALSTEDGSLLWKFETGNLIVASPSLDQDGNLYFGSSDGFFYSLDEDGGLRWFYYVGDEMDSSPAVAQDGAVYVGAYDGSLYAFSADGELRWQFVTEEPVDSDDWRIKAPPTIGENGVVYFGGGNGQLYALEPSGVELWRFELDEKIDTGVVIDGQEQLLFGCRDGVVYCLDENGILVWQSYVGDIFYSTPTLDSEGNVCVGVYLGNEVSGLTTLDSSGEILWEYLVLDYVDGSAVISSDGATLFADYGGSIYAVECGTQPMEGEWDRFGGNRSNRSLQVETAELNAWTIEFYQWLKDLGLENYASLPSIDLDGDGIPLGMEFFMGVYGTHEWQAELPDFEILERERQRTGSLTFTRLKSFPGLRLRVMATADLSAWAQLESLEIETLNDDVFGDGLYEQVRLLFPMTGQRFARLQVDNY